MRLLLPTRSTLPRLAALALLSSLVASMRSACESSDFALESGDTVAFYGDSITEQSLYTQYVELYSITRFPRMRLRFFGAGVGGDRVSGGAGGTIDERLARDVFLHQPSVVTVMLGMNDGGYVPITHDIQETYVQGYQHLLASLQAHAPSARITLLGPSPFDDVTRLVTVPGGYNSVMLHFGKLDRELAQQFSASFVDLNAPVVNALQKAQAENPLAARLLIPDRVHPDPIVHWIMAEAVLAGWKAPSLVSLVTIDAETAKAVDARNASVEKVELENGNLRWTETENALPLPLNSKNASDALLLELTDIQERLNREDLRVTGLASGTYKLTIDGGAIGTFAADQLAKGINLANYETPMRFQAQQVAWGVRDRAEAQRVHLRMSIKKVQTTNSPSGDVMDGYEESLNDANYRTAVPKAHMFSLGRVVPAP